jgi:hypothetical protein
VQISQGGQGGQGGEGGKCLPGRHSQSPGGVIIFADADVVTRNWDPKVDMVVSIEAGYGGG